MLTFQKSFGHSNCLAQSPKPTVIAFTVPLIESTMITLAAENKHKQACFKVKKTRHNIIILNVIQPSLQMAMSKNSYLCV